jgi:hypothetical protein
MAAASLFILLTGVSAAAEPIAGVRLEVIPKGRNFHDKPNHPESASKDVSGIACLPPAADGKRACLVVTDQARHAQWAILSAAGIEPGSVVPLIGKDRPETAFGTLPKASCDGERSQGRWKDLDGEAVAYAAPYFYVVGSHGCSRKNFEFVASSFLLARIEVDGHGKPKEPGKVELTYRLGEMLARTAPVNKEFGRKLERRDGDGLSGGETPNGLNVEGIAVLGEMLYAGLRAPAYGGPAYPDGMAYLVATKVADLFAATDNPSASATPIPLKLGPGRGVRDLAPLSDGRLLVLAGPAQGEKGTYALYAYDPKAAPGTPVTLLADLQGADKGTPPKPPLAEKNACVIEHKAEAVVPLEEGEDLRVLVLSDGAENGGPCIFRMKLRK